MCLRRATDNDLIQPQTHCVKTRTSACRDFTQWTTVSSPRHLLQRCDEPGPMNAFRESELPVFRDLIGAPGASEGAI
jgi:hypothetical protein